MRPLTRTRGFRIQLEPALLMLLVIAFSGAAQYRIVQYDTFPKKLLRQNALHTAEGLLPSKERLHQARSRHTISHRRNRSWYASSTQRKQD